MSVLQSENLARLTLCGSEIDKDALQAAGLRSVMVISSADDICVPGDDGPTLKSELNAYGRFLLAFRGDAYELRDACGMRLGDTRCRWVRWPDDGSSPADILQSSGVDGLGDYLKAHAKPMWTDEVCVLDDVPDEPPQETYRTGFAELDDSIDQSEKRFFRLIRPAFMPVIGPYASGKSVLLRQLACNLWKLHGWRTLITAFEEKIKPRFIRDLRRHLMPEDAIRFSASSNLVTESERAVDAEINKAFRFLRRKRGTMLDADRLLDRIAYAVEVYGVEVVMIDPVNEIDHHVPKGWSKTDYMGDFIMRLKQLADDYKILMIVAAHPPKDGVAQRANKNKIYTLNDGADTAHYGNKADIGWCIWRQSGIGPTYLNIDKCKDTETMGSPTMASFEFKGGAFKVKNVGQSVAAELFGDEDETDQ